MSKASEKVYQRIRSMILSGELKPLEQLREEEVAVWCGVSRTPVRDAMKQLEAEMFISRSSGQRSFVADWSLADVEEFFSLRGMLESHAARRAAARAQPEAIQRLREIVSKVRLAISGSQPDLDAFLEANQQFHFIILEMAASDRLANLLHRLILHSVIHRTATRYDRVHLEQSLAEHDQIISALETNDSDWAASIMIAHIRRAYHVYLENVRATRLPQA